jgi:hypothetical protein
LIDEFGDRIPPDDIEARARDHLEQFREARVPTFVPTLVYRYTRADLRERAA